MSRGRLGGVLQRLRQAVLLDSAGLSDGALLGRYLKDREDAAFAALVRRHGPMVLGVCRRFLRDPHDADDAFQATFLVLVRKAHAIVPRERVGPWLYGVAYRTSLKAKAMSNRRRARQKSLDDVPCPAPPAHAEWLALLDEEINRLPEKYRVAIVLCDLEGKTRKQAAKQLNWPEGTLATRLQHGRALVQKRLARHGLTLSAGALTLNWTEAVAATVPPALASATVQNASLFAAGKGAGMSLKVFALAEGVLKAMVLAKVKTVSAVAVLVGVLGLVGLTGGSRLSADGDTPAPASRESSMPKKAKTYPNPVNFVASGTLDANRRLPSGPAPVQALVRFEDGQVVITTSQQKVVPVTTHKAVRTDEGVEHRSVTHYKFVSETFDTRARPRDVEVRDTYNRKLDSGELPKLLKKEILAYVFAGPGEFDPLHLRLMKEGTLVFIVHDRNANPTPVHATPALEGQVFPNPVNTARAPLPPPTVSEQAVREQAGKDMAIAGFYQRTGHPESAAFYYELVVRRYPTSLESQEAAKLLKELRGQAPAKDNGKCVGQVIIIGNSYLPDALIREALLFHPGKTLQHKSLRDTEERLNRLDKTIDINATVTVLDPGDKAEHMDILVTVRETLPKTLKTEIKRLEGTWIVQHPDLPEGNIEAAFSEGKLTIKRFNRQVDQGLIQHSANRYAFLLSPNENPKGIRLIPLDGLLSSKNVLGSYELVGDTLNLNFDGSRQGNATLRRKKESKKADARLGQIILTGNNYVPAEAIHEVLPFRPGDRLKSADLQAVEEKIKQLSKAVESVKITLHEANAECDFQQIVIEMRESVPKAVQAELKKLEGSWIVTGGSEGIKGAEFVFSANNITVKPPHGQAEERRYCFLLDPEQKQSMRLFALDDVQAQQRAVGGYSLDGDTLRLRIRSGVQEIEFPLRRKKAAP